MIGKAKAISHGINDLRYIMGESINKKHPEKINYICSQHLPIGLDAMGVWESIQASTAGYDKLKNSLIQIELSPLKEHTTNFNLKDWKELWIDFMNEFDSLTLYNKKGKVTSRPTNLTGSKGVIFLHEESKGEIPHLHGAFCRVDEDGNVNNDHDIHLRAQRAAEAVARKRGWKTAMEVRANDIKHVAEVCENVLKAMTAWSWDDYVARIRQVEGGRLKVKARIDSLGQVRGYVIICGNSKYKASEMGRELTISRLAATWRKLHPIAIAKPEDKTITENTIPKVMPATPVRLKDKEVYPPKQSSKSETLKSNATKSQPVNRVDYSSWSSDRRSVDIDVNGTQHQLYLPKNVLKVFDDEFDYREVLNWKPLTNLACAYFTALLAPDVQVSNGGGSSSNDVNWGRDKDEDDIEFARRCAQQAKMKIGLQKKARGYHR